MKPAASRLPRLVIWLVPSLAILSNGRCARVSILTARRLNMLFRNRVESMKRGNYWTVRGSRPSKRASKVGIVILRVTTPFARNKDARKLYQENERLFGDESTSMRPHASADATAFISVIGR